MTEEVPEPKAPRAALGVHQVRKSYRSGNEIREVLRDISFCAEAGEMVAVMGASGAGKSTLLHILGGLEAADSGRIEVNGVEITRAVGSALASARNQLIGFVFQFHHLLRDLTAAENVALPLFIARQPRRASLRRATEMLDEVGLSGFAARPVVELSGGEQQRVAIARSLITRPKLILADEPTGNLDAASGEKCAQLLVSLCRTRGTTVVIATHHAPLARLCDRILLLANGEVTSDQ